jgi:hypothetical protein
MPSKAWLARATRALLAVTDAATRDVRGAESGTCCSSLAIAPRSCSVSEASKEGSAMLAMPKSDHVAAAGMAADACAPSPFPSVVASTADNSIIEPATIMGTWYDPVTSFKAPVM